jgi:hypothetical protein
VNVVDSLDFENRELRPDLAADPQLPEDTRLWSALITASGGLWGGCVYDTDAIVDRLQRVKTKVSSES